MLFMYIFGSTTDVVLYRNIIVLYNIVYNLPMLF